MDGERLAVAGITLEVIHTPGHTPGSVSLYSAELGTVFTGGTLLHGGPDADRRPFGNDEVLVDSIAERLMILPGTTAVRAGCGEITTIGAERAVIDSLTGLTTA